MNEELLRGMNLEQLLTEAKAQGIEVIGSKKATHPSKEDAIKAILAKFAFSPEDDEEGDEENSEVVEVEPVSTQSELELMRLQLFRKIRVIVHDTQDNQTNDKDELMPVGWGNTVIGGQTSWVAMDGEPQYVAVGALNNLKDVTTIAHIEKKGASGGAIQKVMPRFIISEVEGLTPEELEVLKAKQALRDAKN